MGINVGETLMGLVTTSGIYQYLTNPLALIMVAIACVLLYLAIVKQFEPLLLLPIAFGMLLTNLLGSDIFHEELFAGGHANWALFGGAVLIDGKDFVDSVGYMVNAAGQILTSNNVVLGHFVNAVTIDDPTKLVPFADILAQFAANGNAASIILEDAFLKNGAVYTAIKKRENKKPDVAVLYSDLPCSCAACFTTNKFCAAPVILDREILKKGKARAVVINSGNANAATGKQGIEDARTVEREAEKLLGLGEDEVFVCSTGVIGQRLPVDKVLQGIREIIPAKLAKENGSEAAYAIMTTDTVRKECAYELQLSTGTVKIGAMAKGSGMIHPNMATMLVYVTTDAKADPADLQKMLSAAVDKSFNMCTVDGDTSTNDSIFLLANGASGVEIKTEEDKKAMADLVLAICTDMARRVASDGEGATHLIEVEAYGLPTEHDARLVAKSIAGSMLFKAAVFGRDANWGRIMAAAGYSGADVDPTRADCIIKSAAGEVQVMKDGFGADFSEELAKKVLTEHDITVIVRFYQGDGEAKAWGCDLTYDYVKINGDYRT